MRLIGKHILMLITNGVEEQEYMQLKKGFESEQASVIVTSPGQYITVESLRGNERGEDIITDIPLDGLEGLYFDALVIPDGLLSTDALRKNNRVINLISAFHDQGLPIFASGRAIEILYDCKVLFSQIVVREETPIDIFLDKAVTVLVEQAPAHHVYRSTISV